MKRYILALAIVISCFVSADASSIYGKVIDVNSGDVITIFNLNRPVRVKLLGIDAPELNQAFGDVAKRHLSDLVFEKGVLVEYDGIAADSSLTGRVLLNDADIGAQMIRDGVAWFDPVTGSRLSANDREVYAQSELAARGEKRGLWQQENPVAPWEFVKAEAMRRNPAPSLKEIVSDAKPRRSGPVPELTNLTLMAVRANSAPASSEASSARALSATRKNWSRFQPAGESFSVEIPEDGERMDISAPFAGQPVEIRGYRVRDGWAVYALSWFKAPSFGETDEIAFKGIIDELKQGAVESYRDTSGIKNLSCQSPTQKNISQNGYTGFEFDLTSCRIPARIRLYTRVVDNERQFYIGTVIYSEEETENVRRFLNSFIVGSARTRKR